MNLKYEMSNESEIYFGVIMTKYKTSLVSRNIFNESN